MTRQRVEIHVEELVLRGLSAADARGVGEAVERELMRLLEGGAVVPAGGCTSRLDAGSFELGRGPVARAIAMRVAASVHGSLAP
jgi:hypothetical protein